jgi:hypothetical protein
MNTDFAAPKAEALVKAARTDIVGVGTGPNPVRHLSLGETRQSATHSLALGGRGDEDLVELTDIGFEREKAGEPVSGIDANKHFHPEANSTGMRARIAVSVACWATARPVERQLSNQSRAIPSRSPSS